MMKAAILAISLLASAPAVAEITLYTQLGTGYQINMTDYYELRGEGVTIIQRQDLPNWVADIQLGVMKGGWFLQGQHVSSPATRQDRGFTVISTGYRWEFSF